VGEDEPLRAMSHAHAHTPRGLPDSELRAAIERSFGRAVTEVARVPSRYATSAALEEVSVAFSASECISLILKDLGRPALLRDAARHKPDFLHDPRREVETYREILSKLDLGTAQCHAAEANGDARRFWLLLEKVSGVELYQVGDLARWEDVARWLARMHRRLRPWRQGSGAPLLVHDRDHHRRWAERAIAALEAAGSERATGLAARLARSYEAVIDELVALPRTVIHGEFHASNVLVGDHGRVCPVDWEMAAVGAGVTDLAALSSGGWSAGERRRMWAAYRAEAAPEERLAGEREFVRALGCASLAHCIQWLGWSPGWQPPPEHAHDWLGEACEQIEELEVGPS